MIEKIIRKTKSQGRKYSQSRQHHNLPLIIQAPMAGGITTPELVAAVSNTGALGSFATGYLSTDQASIGIKAIKQLTDKPFSANLFIPNEVEENIDEIKRYQTVLNRFREKLGLPVEHELPKKLYPNDNFDELVELLLVENIKVVSFTFGNLPKSVIRAFKENDTFLIGTATTLKEGLIMAESGIDAIVAQGYEAGGHRGGFFSPPESARIGSMALIPQLVDNINLPIIAAGGIMDGRGIAAANALGASSVQMGTAFLSVEESGANQTYREKLLEMKKSLADATVLTDVFSGKEARGFKTSFVSEFSPEEKSCIPDYPIPNTLSGPIRKESGKQGSSDFMSVWAGQGFKLIRNGVTAKELIAALNEELEEQENSYSKSSEKDRPTI